MASEGFAGQSLDRLTAKGFSTQLQAHGVMITMSDKIGAMIS